MGTLIRNVTLLNNKVELEFLIPSNYLDLAYLGLGLAILRSVSECSEGYLSVKWPNEVLCGNKVLASYTLNSSGSTSKGRSVIRAVINLNPNLIGDVGGFSALIKTVLNNILSDINEGVISKYVIEYARNLALLGEDIVAELVNGSRVRGEVLGLRRDSSLIILTDTGLRSVSPSEVKRVTRLWPVKD